MEIPDFMANTWEPPEYREPEEPDYDRAYDEAREEAMEV